MVPGVPSVAGKLRAMSEKPRARGSKLPSIGASAEGVVASKLPDMPGMEPRSTDMAA